MDYATRCRLLRISHHWSQYELATRAGISQSAVSRIENKPHYDRLHIAELAHAFGISLDLLADGSDEDIAKAYNQASQQHKH